MSSQFKKFSMAAVALTALGYLVGCGTAGNNTGFEAPPDGFTPPTATGTSSSSAAAASSSSSTTSGLTGGATGSSTVNPNLPATAATGLTISNMLPTTGGAGGATNAPTRLGIGNFGALGDKVVVVQGNGNGIGQGRVVLLPRNPDATAGSSNILTVRTSGTPAPPTLSVQDPFGLLVESSTIYFTNNFRTAGAGSVVKVSNIIAGGNAQFDVVGVDGAANPFQNLNNPIDVVRGGTNILFVAEYRARGGGGQIRRINESTGLVDVLVADVNFCSSMVLDTSGGRNFLYLAENGNNSGSGNFGGIARVDLSTFIPGTSLTTGGVGSTPSTGVTFIPPVTGQPAYANPFDLAVDDVGNVAVSEGISMAGDLTTFAAPVSQGRIRVIAGNSGGTPATTSQLVLDGLTGTRGVSIVREDSGGAANTVFFIEGPQGLNSTTRQVTFTNTNGAIFRHLLLDSGRLNALDTLYDAGSTTAPVVAPNLKTTISFLGTTQGQVLDIR